MNKDFLNLSTTSQFAKLHNVNKRTLHYYDKKNRIVFSKK